MTRWIAIAEIETELVLPDGAPPICYDDPRGEFRVRIANLAVRPLADTPLLELHIEFDAPDLAAAAEGARAKIRDFVRLMSFTTQTPFRLRQVNRIVDWSPGLSIREQMIYHVDRTALPHPALLPDFVTTIGTLTANPMAPEVRVALRWFANGLGARLMEEQFQYFFFAIEVLAEYHKPTERVPDKCPRCSTALFCSSCDETPTHRPYAKQAIESLVSKLINGWPDAFQVLNLVRNRMMHGKSREEIQCELVLPLDEVVDRAGRVAWTAILNSIVLPPGEHRLDLAEVSTFVQRTVTVGIHASMGMKGGDPNNPTVDQLGSLEISVERNRELKPKPS